MSPTAVAVTATGQEVVVDSGTLTRRGVNTAQAPIQQDNWATGQGYQQQDYATNNTGEVDEAGIFQASIYFKIIAFGDDKIEGLLYFNIILHGIASPMAEWFRRVTYSGQPPKSLSRARIRTIIL